jgi:hypothetical protein
MVYIDGKDMFIEIGKQKEIALRDQNGIPVLDNEGRKMTRVVASETWRVTRNILGNGYGPDSKRKLVVGLVAGDVLVLKPVKTRQSVSVELRAVYRWLLRNKAIKIQLEKARTRKAAIQARRSARRLKYAERKLQEPSVVATEWFKPDF